MGEGGRRPGEGTRLGRGEGERETFFNATGLAEIRLGALESDLSRRNQMKADEGGRRMMAEAAGEKIPKGFHHVAQGCEERATLG